jgi:hypothetical protein
MTTFLCVREVLRLLPESWGFRKAQGRRFTATRLARMGRRCRQGVPPCRQRDGRCGKLPTLQAADPDAAWRAAALMHTIVRLEPLPFRNSLFAAFVAAQYMDQSGEGIDPPYGALAALVQKIRDTRLRVPEAADRIRSWRS